MGQRYFYPLGIDACSTEEHGSLSDDQLVCRPEVAETVLQAISEVDRD